MTKPTIETTVDPYAMAKLIDRGCKHPSQVEKGREFASNLASILMSLGWEEYESYSYCKVASFEQHLQKGHRRIEIISSSFIGVFTIMDEHQVDTCDCCSTERD